MTNIHGICLVKDEADVITRTLKTAIQWCDFIYVFDNGSTDGTWEKILSLSQNYRQITPYKQDAKPFHNGLRSEVFNHYRSISIDGDWWCVLDADEFYIDNPRIFLAKVSERYQVVWNASFQYYFTDKDLFRYDEEPEFYADDVPVEQKIRYYLNNWSEFRFFRYKSSLVWHETASYPSNLGAVYPVRIWLKHFQYRSPQQIQKRLNVRYEAGRPFTHEIQRDWKATVLDTSKTSSQNIYNRNAPPSWKERIVQASEFNYDAHDGRYLVREDLMPELPRDMVVEITSFLQTIPIPKQLWTK